MSKFSGVRKCLVCIALLSLLVPGPSRARSASDTGKEIIKLEDDWRTARIKGDVAFLEKFYAKELRITGSDGSIIERNSDIALFASGQVKPDYIKYEDLKVSVYCDGVVVVTGLDRLRGTYKGQSGEIVSRFTDILVRRDGRWQLVSTQATVVQEK